MTSKTEVPDDLQRAQHAVEQGDWDEALRLVDGQATGTHGPTSLRLRGLAEYGRGNLEAAVTAFEACYAAQLERDDDAGAAAAAGTVAMYLMMDTGLMAPVRAWLARGRRLIGEPPVDDVAADDDATHALLAMVRTYERFLSGDPDGTRTAAADAVRLGTRGNFPPAVALGRVATARLAILDGDVTDGLSMLDDVAATLVAGALDPP